MITTNTTVPTTTTIIPPTLTILQTIAIIMIIMQIQQNEEDLRTFYIFKYWFVR